MATKRTGVACYDKAGENEELFVLRAQDVLAPQVIRHWAGLAELGGTNPEIVLEALQCAQRMEAWPHRKHPGTSVERHSDLARQPITETTLAMREEHDPGRFSVPMSVMKRIAARYAGSRVHIFPHLPELTPVEAVLRCAREEGFILASNPVYWNPYNKVVQDHRDGSIDYEATNRARKHRGLPVPWTPEMATTEVHEDPIP
jgi:hypothetical protein